MIALSGVLNRPILMAQKGVQMYAPVVLAALQGKDIAVDENVFIQNQKLNAAFALNNPNASNASDNSKKVSVISIIGAITKYDQPCGPSGLTTKLQYLNAAAQEDSIGAIILKIDSPGGEGSFLDVFAQAIRQIDKPVIAYIEGMAASAGYWIASQADEIFASSTMDMIGSIGAYVTLADYKKYFEQKGIDIKEVYADASTEKNKFFHDLFSEEPDDTLLKASLNELVDKFHADINIKRNINDTHALAGAIFHGEDALQTNLIDGFKSFDEVVQHAFQLIQNNQNNQLMAKEKNYPHIAQSLNFENDTIVLTEDHASLSETQLDHLEAALEKVHSEKQQVQDLTQKLADKDKVLQEKDDSIAQLQTDVEKLKNKAAGKGTTTQKSKDDFGDGNHADPFAHFAHNKIVDEMT